MPVESTKARGATRNATPTRFNLKERVVEGDWLDSVEALDGIAPRRTTVTIEQPQDDPDPQLARPTSASTARSTPIAGASMAASIASRGRPTPITTCRPAWISKAGCSPSPTPPSCSTPPCRAPAMRSRRSRSAPTPIPISRSRSAWRITRSILELLLETRHPFTITTKSDRVLRDLDIIVPAARARARLGGDFGDLARPGDPPHARAARRRRRASASPRSRRSPRPASRPMSRSPRSSRRSPTMSSRRSSRRRRRPARAAASSCRCACRTRSRPCSAPGSTSIIPTAPPRSWRRSARCAAARDNDPNFFTRMRGQGVWADLLAHPLRESRRKRYGLAAGQIRRSAATCSSRPQGDQLRLL